MKKHVSEQLRNKQLYCSSFAVLCSYLFLYTHTARTHGTHGIGKQIIIVYVSRGHIVLHMHANCIMILKRTPHLLAFIFRCVSLCLMCVFVLISQAGQPPPLLATTIQHTHKQRTKNISRFQLTQLENHFHGARITTTDHVQQQQQQQQQMSERHTKVSHIKQTANCRHRNCPPTILYAAQIKYISPSANKEIIIIMCSHTVNIAVILQSCVHAMQRNKRTDAIPTDRSP